MQHHALNLCPGSWRVGTHLFQSIGAVLCWSLRCVDCLRADRKVPHHGHVWPNPEAPYDQATCRLLGRCGHSPAGGWIPMPQKTSGVSCGNSRQCVKWTVNPQRSVLRLDIRRLAGVESSSTVGSSQKLEGEPSGLRSSPKLSKMLSLVKGGYQAQRTQRNHRLIKPSNRIDFW